MAEFCHLNMTQLDPVIPVNVVKGRGWKGPTGPAMAIGWWQQSMDHHLVWIVAFDSSGQI